MELEGTPTCSHEVLLHLMAENDEMNLVFSVDPWHLPAGAGGLVLPASPRRSLLDMLQYG